MKFKSLVVILMMNVLCANAMVTIKDQDFPLGGSFYFGPFHYISEAINKDVFGVVIEDSFFGAANGSSSSLKFVVNQGRTFTFHVGKNLVFGSSPDGLSNFSLVKKRSCGVLQWVIEPNHYLVFSPANSFKSENFPKEYLVWKAGDVFSIKDSDLVIEDDLDLPAGDIVVEAATKDVVVRFKKDLICNGNRHGNSRIHFVAHEHRKIIVVFDRIINFASSNSYTTTLLAEECGAVKWQIKGQAN